MDSLERGVVKNKSGVGVLDKAVAVLSLLAEEGPVPLAGVVEATGIPRPTAHRILSALEAHHLVVRDRRGYSLGVRVYGWGNRAAGARLVDAARPVLAALRDETGESTQLYVREGEHRVCVACVERAAGLRDTVPVGAVLPLERGSAGKVLLAYSEDGGERLGSGEAREIRARGWAESVAEREAGVASVSAPVFGAGGVLRGAVCASGPIFRLGERPGERLAGPVVAAARELGRALGG
ncbi:putative HTH-type transcriptional regulator RhmR [Rubrobacter xylanophilus DSM 9941]|uniref:IclR family transcriptional regulator n=1 Tax=Rubrobacter xylanophilus TaxID=49319 RepID=UPI001C63BF57|nr:IclR family transcriptional regulator [Rubrobacter xylanophilus]QYJ16501.1 putative HTH-type transcriptional regulator RhmR [Rubrobacter xylanophilus DSM 9941]